MKTTGRQRCPAEIHAPRNLYFAFKDQVESDKRGKRPQQNILDMKLRDLPSGHSFSATFPIHDGASLILEGPRLYKQLPLPDLRLLRATNESVRTYCNSPSGTLTPEQVRAAMLLMEPFGPEETGALTATLALPERAEFNSFPLLAAIGKLYDPHSVSLVPTFESVGDNLVRAKLVFDALRNGCDPKLAATVNAALRARTHIEAVSKAFRGIEDESSSAFDDAKEAVAQVDGVFGGLGLIVQAAYDAVANTPSLKDVVQFIADAD